MRSGFSRFCGFAIAVFFFCAVGPLVAQGDIFSDGFESGDATAWANFGPEVCNNWVDDDGDGRRDCVDYLDCSNNSLCDHRFEQACTNMFDYDGDTYIDCDDFDCSENPTVTLTLAGSTLPSWVPGRLWNLAGV